MSHQFYYTANICTIRVYNKIPDETCFRRCSCAYQEIHAVEENVAAILGHPAITGQTTAFFAWGAFLEISEAIGPGHIFCQSVW